MRVAATAAVLVVITVNMYNFNNPRTGFLVSAAKQTAERRSGRCHACNKDYTSENLETNNTNEHQLYIISLAVSIIFQYTFHLSPDSFKK